jgi:O-acetyl-ADP-ribose deacetylase
VGPGIRIAYGDLIEQNVEVIVNAWNRNIFPWWLLLPQGVSRSIRKKAGLAPFRELARMPMIPLGGAVLTSPGGLGFKAIIHVAGINLFWMGSEFATCESAKNAITLARAQGFKSIAIPTIGAGTGGISEARSVELIELAAQSSNYSGDVVIVRFRE